MLRRASISALFFAAVTASALPSAFAFGEEPGAEHSDGTTVSTHHLHLTHALAVCAGVPASDNYDAPNVAERLALFDEMVDSGDLGLPASSGSPSSLCGAPAYTVPTPSAAGCAPGTGSKVAYPILSGPTAWDPAGGCFTDRFGPYSSFFHFPKPAGLAALKAWALGQTSTLMGKAQFAYGGPSATLYDAQCYAQRAEAINTGGVTAGSVEAFAIYLHTLGDSYSHGVCRDNWGNKSNPPWYTHTVTNDPFGCIFTAHTWEFGCPTSDHVSFVANDVAASQSIYGELVSWATARGYTPKISSFSAHGSWLLRQVQIYALIAGYMDPQQRIDFTNALEQGCKDAAGTANSVCLADVDPYSDASCSTYQPAPACVSALSAGGVTGPQALGEAEAPSAAAGCSMGRSGPASAALVSVLGLAAAVAAARRRSRRSPARR